ncbi:MAG: hypothetical protein GWN00_23975 [Aliifodinibius sp.]|nr:hypothetical protein [Fodinibius sp.]NIY27750.1 hypothetical protein [Fodinibius sp.]
MGIAQFRTVITPTLPRKATNRRVTKQTILKRIKSASEKRPVSAKTLKMLTTGRNGHDTADTRRIIRELIKDGHPIASNTYGYFYIRSPKQCQRYLNRLLKQQTRMSERISDTYHAYFKS